MGSADQLEAVDAVKLGRHTSPEQPACPSGADSPGVDILRIAPHQVAEGALVRDLAHPLNGPHLGVVAGWTWLALPGQSRSCDICYSTEPTGGKALLCAARAGALA